MDHDLSEPARSDLKDELVILAKRRLLAQCELDNVLKREDRIRKLLGFPLVESTYKPSRGLKSTFKRHELQRLERFVAFAKHINSTSPGVFHIPRSTTFIFEGETTNIGASINKLRTDMKKRTTSSMRYEQYFKNHDDQVVRNFFSGFLDDNRTIRPKVKPTQTKQLTEVLERLYTTLNSERSYLKIEQYKSTL
jgi:hypothetical protein